jgi:sporulation protein YlmC with PRC-barrel domain
MPTERKDGQMQTLTRDALVELQGMDVVDANGEKIGTVEDVYYDDDTGRAEWIGIGTGIFGLRRRVVPVIGARREDDAIRVPYPKDLVKDSPTVDGDHISPEQEEELYAHYGSSARPPMGADLESGRVNQPMADADRRSSGAAEDASDTGEPAIMVVRLRRWVWVVPDDAHAGGRPMGADERSGERAMPRR